MADRDGTPVAIIAAGSGNLKVITADAIIAAGSGNIVAAGSHNVVGAGSYNVVGAGAHNLLGVKAAEIVAAGSYILAAAGGAKLETAPRSSAPPSAGWPAPRWARASWPRANNFATKASAARRRGPVTLAKGQVRLVKDHQRRTLALVLTKAGRKVVTGMAKRNRALARRHKRLRRLKVTLVDRFEPLRQAENRAADPGPRARPAQPGRRRFTRRGA